MESLIQDPNVQEFLRSWEADGEARGEARGKACGKEEEARALLYRVLAARAMTVSEAVRERIDAEPDVARLEGWHDAAVTAGSVDDVFGDGDGDGDSERR